MRILFFLGLFNATAALATETMRIAVGTVTTRAVIEGSAISSGEDQDTAVLSPRPQRRIVVAPDKGASLTVGAEPWPKPEIRFRSDGPLRVDGVALRGDVVVLRSGAGLQVVNVIPMEAYIAAVLGSEMAPNFPSEALKAQAIAARTFALSKKLAQYGQPYYLGSSVLSQVYKGLAAEDPRARQAVLATTGLVLTWRLQPIAAYFHASCGGHTETGREGLGNDQPYLPSVACACAQSPSTNWSLRLSKDDFRALGARVGEPIKVTERTATGRVKTLSVGKRSVTGVTFRKVLGYRHARSLFFEVVGARLVGRGYGHGVGMCQVGAKIYASRGWTYQQILAHYYPGTEIQRLYD